MTYKPYRTPQRSVARGPIISPEEPLTCNFDASMVLARQEASVISLAAATGRLLGKLSMPETVLFTLDGDRRRFNEGEIPASDKDFAIKATRIDEQEYDVATSVYTADGLVDELSYVAWQPSREGFVMPWGAKIIQASRTIYPRIRAHSVSEVSSLALPTAPVNATRLVLDALAKERLMGAVQHEPLSIPSADDESLNTY